MTELIAACTLGEGTYHAGTGALANSLYANGFKGKLFIGYRGALPDWAKGQNSLALPSGMQIIFQKMEWERNPNFEKATFMLTVLDENPEISAVAYFDSDVVVRVSWRFFQDWSTRGVGLCMDNWPCLVPQGHPWRLAWAETASQMGHQIRDIDYYCNAGFVLVPRQHRAFLNLWRDAVATVLTHLGDENPVTLVKYGEAWNPYGRSDQDAMAIAMMASEVPLSIVGTDGMSFTTGANLMTHAVNNPKPWNRSYLRDAFLGIPPLAADRAFWENSEAPIPVFDGSTLRIRRLTLQVATVISSFFRRPRFWAAN